MNNDRAWGGLPVLWHDRGILVQPNGKYQKGPSMHARGTELETAERELEMRMGGSAWKVERVKFCMMNRGLAMW